MGEKLGEAILKRMGWEGNSEVTVQLRPEKCKWTRQAKGWQRRIPAENKREKPEGKKNERLG